MRRIALALPVVLCIGSTARAAEADPLAELAKLGDSVAETAQEGGGSIRAKKDVDLTRDKRLKDPRNVEAKVESLKTGAFPAVALKLKVLKPSKEGAGKDLKANETIVVTPKLKSEGGKIALTDNETVLNSGSFYLQDGDKVMVRLGEKTGKVWQAEYIERK
jgi:hypothetical protein